MSEQHPYYGDELLSNSSFRCTQQEGQAQPDSLPAIIIQQITRDSALLSAILRGGYAHFENVEGAKPIIDQHRQYLLDSDKGDSL